MLIEAAVIVIDDNNYLITPKSSKLTTLKVGFRARKGDSQPQLSHILKHITASPFSSFVQEVVYTQTFSVVSKKGSGPRVRLVRQIYVLLKTGLGRFPEPRHSIAIMRNPWIEYRMTNRVYS